MDFYKIKERSAKNGVVEVYPDFRVGRSKDLMVRGRSFYAIWDEEKGLWSTDEYDVQRLVDADLEAHAKRLSGVSEGLVSVKYLGDFSSSTWLNFRNYLNHISDSSHQLDESLTFSNSEVRKQDYVSKRLPYPLESGSYTAWDELIGTLYHPEERAKLEWAIGSIVAGDAKDIQKFIVLYGEQGSGKSTILNVIQKLFAGYYTTFEAKALTSSNNAFSTEVFRSNPLVAIQHDGDLSKIEDNTKLNSIISHEEMVMNEKYKPSYTSRINCFLFMGTNRPVKITDAKSGIIRRLIDVKPSGNRLPPRRYQALMVQIEFELGAIASHCLDVYREMGRDYYNGYRPVEMMLQTDVFYNFIESNYHVFSEQDGVSLSQAYDMYKVYCDEALVEFKLARHKFREELKNYFRNFHEVTRIDGKQVRSYYSGFMTNKLVKMKMVDEPMYSLVLDKETSLIDELYSDQPAQYATINGTPQKKWNDVKTVLRDINTREEHYVRPPQNHIVIDFDLVDSAGKKSVEYNLAAASKWPPTYSEFSKSGAGVHLHYLYDGDVERLARVYDEGIEIKVFTGHASLRRRLSKCNGIPITTINSGLPLREKEVLNDQVVKSERGLRELIIRNLNKEIHPSTKPSIDFIKKILDDAYAQGLHYDLTDLRPRIMAFANNSTNQSAYCLKVVTELKFKSEEPSEDLANYSNDDVVFFDVEVFPNLFIVCWKVGGPDKTVVKMINPKPSDIEGLLNTKLVGFNNRRYDNHILYARYLGYSNEDLYKLSSRLVNNSKNATFAEAYSLSYADIYDFSSVKQTLKKFEIDLGIHHMELGLDWNTPVDESMWVKVAEYCANDVLATEAVWEARKADFTARQILADLSGLTVNDTTQKHTAAILFGKDKTPQEKFVYTDLSEEFPGYKYEFGKSTYRDLDPSEGGYVYAEPGIHENVALLDVASLHPTSLIKMNAFGPYTKKYKELMDARLAIKHKEYDKARKMLDGKLEPYLTDESDAKNLSYALKIVINIVYGLTSAKFENPFRDPRNVDNIVAKRGALFMIDLQHYVQEQGFTVAHIKTDSIKIPNATPEIIEKVMKFGKKYGYTFEHEKTYSKMCLVNEAVYIAKIGWSDDESEIGKWTATGAQFAQPYVFKTLFSQEPISFRDMQEAKSVTTAIYLDMNEGMEPDEHKYMFIGRVGLFCPVKPGTGGGLLMRQKDENFHAVTGTKGYRWKEAEVIEATQRQDDIDRSYYDNLVDTAIKTIGKFGDVEQFLD